MSIAISNIYTIKTLFLKIIDYHAYMGYIPVVRFEIVANSTNSASETLYEPPRTKSN